ncbi:MAG: lectin like domain-containing protein [Prolixibacteraceae bacterium]|jgi:C1A family cysteine protease|nr:lectin like domain-containing protein [Prolixibacteraceae bacterium]
MNSRNTFLLILLIIVFNNLFSQIPSYYDSRNHNWVSPVKNQGDCGSCWAFASCAAIESSLLKQGYVSYDLSEDNLIDCHAFDQAPCEWGNYYMTHSLIASHKAILQEKDAPYNPNTISCPMNNRFPPSLPFYIEEMQFVPADEIEIKRSVMAYGAVASAMYFNMENYSSSSYKYYDNSIDESDYPHCVTIVGWNDTLTFNGATGKGGWIIKDSYGTNWANNGYFYCSYHDAGILSENVVFPSFSELPPSVNKTIVYDHDEFGWVNNYGFSSNEAFALVKYTIRPLSSSIGAQQIKRIGTWAVEDNSSIEYSLYRTKNGNSLENPITSGSINCENKGFYTIPLNVPSDTLFSDIYIKIKYTCPNGISKPIPVEEKEEDHTTAFSPSTDACWISSDGQSWKKTGSGTSYNFDLCIKMYTEAAPIAEINDFNQEICQNEIIDLSANIVMVDSQKWYVNNTLVSTESELNHLCMQPGETTISLKVWLGHNSDSTSKTLMVNDVPGKPVITQNGNTLESSTATSYQWLFNDMNPISDQVSQSFMPQTEGDYIVKVGNSFSCFNYSDPFPFYFVGILSQQEHTDFKIFPSPATSFINVEFPHDNNSTEYCISFYSSDGSCILRKNITNKQMNTIDVRHLKKGIYAATLTIDNVIIGATSFKIK